MKKYWTEEKIKSAKYNELKLENAALEKSYRASFKRVQEVEGELALIKGIGNNSPEMKALIEKNNKLVERIADLEVINKSHQTLNGQLRIEITRLKGGM